MSVLRDMERLFLHTEHRVVSAFPVIKCASSSQSRNRTIKPPQPTGKPRVLCVTVQRRVGSRGFKATLHICKGEPGHYDIRKSFRLRLLTKLEAFRPPTATQPLLEITVMQRAFTGGDSKLSFEASSDASRGEIIGLLYSFCKSHEERSPLVVGLQRAEMGMYADVLEDDEYDDADEEYGKGNIIGEDSSSQMIITPRNTLESTYTNTTPIATNSAAAGSPGADVVGGGDRRPTRKVVFGGIHDGDGFNNVSGVQQRNSTSLSVVEAEMNAAWSARQDTQLASLLDAVAGGGTSLNDVRSRLTAELAALQGANVHELLESAAAAGSIEHEIGSTLEFVDDLEETLGMLDAKLRHMREDMAAIEDWNNKLETHSRSNVRLLATLESVASALVLEQGTEAALQAPEWDQQVLPSSHSTSSTSSAVEKHIKQGSYTPLEQAISAAWDLHKHLLIVSAETPAATASAAAAFNNNAPSFSSFLSKSSNPMVMSGSVSNNPSRSASAAAASRLPFFISPRLQSMSAVLTRKRYMQDLAKNFLHRATDLLKREYSHIADGLVKLVAALPAGDRLRIPVHTQLHTRAAELKSLMEVVVAMRPGAAAPLQSCYCNTPARTASEPAVVGGRGGHHRRRSSLTGGGADGKEVVSFARPLEDCFESLVSTFFPVLTTEVEKCLELVCLCQEEKQRDPSTARNEAISTLLSGIAEAILSFLDTLRAPKVLPCLAMIATTLHWQAKLAGVSASAAVCDILKQCERKLRSIWDAYVADSVTAIQHYDGKSGMGGYSSVHVLPFVINLEAVASRIEKIVTDWIQRDLSSSNSRSRSPSPHKEPTLSQKNKGNKDSNAQLASVENPVAAPAALKPSPFEAMDQNSTSVAGIAAPSNQSSSSSQHISLSRGGSMVAITPAAAVRALADSLYNQVLDAMLASVESHAAHDVKHAPRIKLENYSFLRLSLQGLPLSQAPVLQKKCSEAATLRNTALAACVEQQLEILKLDKLVHLAGQLAEFGASGISPSEAGARLQWTSADARQAVSAAASGLDKRFSTARQKLHKHLGASSPYLIDVVWERTGVRCGQAWEDLEQRLPAVFPGVGVVPTSEGLTTAFNAAKVASP
ncbi:hypothetical protein Ndes2437B_g03168 [Nannochloris sp. 'desiccata']